MTKRESNFLDTLTGLIPGYAGYADREARRSQDKRLRDHVAEQLDRCKRHLDGLIFLATQRGALEGLDEIDRLKQLVGTCADSLRHAAYGASGLMDDVVVKAADLEKVYKHDLGLNGQAEDLGTTIASLTSETFKEALPGIRQKAKDLQKAIEQRDGLLREVFD
jgi:hypothetical protein